MLLLHSYSSVGEVTILPSIWYVSFLPAELKFSILKMGTAGCAETVGPVDYSMQQYRPEDRDLDIHCPLNRVSNTVNLVLLITYLTLRALVWKRVFSYQVYSRVEQISTSNWCDVSAWSWGRSCLVWTPLFPSFQSRLTERCVPKNTFLLIYKMET